MTPLATRNPGGAVGSLIADLKAYCLPGGDEAARGVRGIKAAQKGEIRSSRDARWNPFVAEEFVDATRAAFRWEARMGTGLLAVRVTDAYEEGHGRLVVSKGPIELKTLAGPDVDKGELQRYLGYIGYCPPMLVNNPSLDLLAVGPRTVQARDRQDATGASVEIDFSDDGRPILIRAVRPMVVGKRVIPTPWSASGSEPEERDGLRIWRRMEAAWHSTEGSFTYIRIELTSFTIVR
jgi:Family of unknown function (DUF6544)